MNTPVRVPWTRSHCVLGFHAKMSAMILGLGFAGRQCVGPANPSCLGLTTEIIGARFWLSGNLSRHAGSPRPDRRSRPVAGQFSDTAFFTSAAILASSAAVNPLSANAAGHMLPSSRFALSLKPNVAYLVLNFAAAWKKQTTLSFLAYAGIPYHSLGERPGALSLMIACSRLAMLRSGSRISAIFASTAVSPSPVPAFISWTRSLIAPRSSSVNALRVAVVLLADFCMPFCAEFMEVRSSSELNYSSQVQSLRFQSASLSPCCRDCSQPSERDLPEERPKSSQLD